MIDYPEYVEVEGKKYKINTDFRIAIKCNEIAQDETISDYERALAVLYLLFGDEGLDTPAHYEKLLKCAKKYLSCGKELNNEINEKPDMDFAQDMDYIEASFMSDFHIDLSKEEMHWWKFFKLINGLSNSELGNCCVLNRIRNLRNFDVSQIKDAKEKDKIIKAKRQVALKTKEKEIEVDLTEEQQKSVDEFYKSLGF